MCLSILVTRPDLEIEQDTFRGYEYAIVRNEMGYRCGYIKVNPGHPWHGKDYSDIDAYVHGGLTFAEADMPCDKEGEDNGYWIGFDCGHYYDAPDPELACQQFTFINPGEDQIIRTTLYVRDNLHDLIVQAIAA